MDMKSLPVASAAAFAFAMTLGSNAHATLIASEQFSYAANQSLGGQSGGGGWAGPWQNPGANFKAIGAIPNIPGGLLATGGSLQITAADSRALRPIACGPGSAAEAAGVVETVPTQFGGTQAVIGKPGTTVWLAFVSRGHTGSGSSAGSHLYESFDAAGGFTSGNKNGEVMFFGRGGMNANYGYERTCGHSIGCPVNITNGEDYQSTKPYNDGVTHWMVHKIDFAVAGTTITMWQDPTPAANDPPGANALDLSWINNGGTQTSWQVYPFHFGWVELESAGTTSDFDEYRIGTTYADVSQSTSVVTYDAGTGMDASAGGGGADGGTGGGTGGGGTGGGGGGSGGGGAGGGGADVDGGSDPAPTGESSGCRVNGGGATDSGFLAAILAAAIAIAFGARKTGRRAQP